jgi:hypothetical protein
MNTEEINAIAELTAKAVFDRLEDRLCDMREDISKHERILKGNNGDAGLIERVRRNTESVRKLYAGIGFIVGAAVLQIVAWIANRIDVFFIN